MKKIAVWNDRWMGVCPGWHILVFALVSLLSALILVPEGFALKTSDMWIMTVVADHLRLEGEVRAYAYGMLYGGLQLSWLRALWVAIWTLFMPGQSVVGHLFFSFWATPLMMTVAFYFLLREYCSKTAAFWVSLTLSAGFQYWLNMGGIDFYQGLLLSACALLVIKARFPNPFLELSRQGLFWAAALCGFSLYGFQAALIYIVALFVPWDSVVHALKSFLAPADRSGRILARAGAIFLFLYVYLTLFGKRVAEISGKGLVLHAGPNLDLALACFALFYAKLHLGAIKREHFVRAALVLGGVLLGLLPEILHTISNRSLPAMPSVAHPGEVSKTLGTLMPAFVEMLLGDTGMSPYQGILRIAPLVLGLLSIWALIRVGIKNAKFWPILAALVLCVIAYSKVYTSNPGNSRYLYPFFPALVLGMGVWVDRVKDRGLLPWAVGLLLLNGAYQMTQHAAWAEWSRAGDLSVNIQKVAGIFEKAGFKSVITEHYSHSVAYTVAAGERVLFAPPSHAWIPLTALTLAKSETRVGILLKETNASASAPEITLLDRRFRLTPLASVGAFRLYQGDVIQ